MQISKKHVLVAEDESFFQYLAQQTLEELGCEIDIVADGQAAVDRCRTVKYDLILMDIRMPILNGYEAAIAIRELGLTTIPIYGVSGSPLPDDAKRCADAGMNGYLVKPIDSVELKGILNAQSQYNLSYEPDV